MKTGWDWLDNNMGAVTGAAAGGLLTSSPTWGALGGYLGSKADDARGQNAGYPGMEDYYAGMPAAPTDMSGGVGLDTQGLDRFKQEAFRNGPSAWAKLSTQQQQMNADAARDHGTAEVGAQQAKAGDQLAMSGGLTSGARERLAAGGARNQLDMSQGVGKQQTDNNMQIGINDEQNRISQLGSVPGMDLANARFNLSKAQGQNEFNANNYQTQGSIWGAGKQADAEDPRNPKSPNYDNGKRWFNPFSW